MNKLLQQWMDYRSRMQRNRQVVSLFSWDLRSRAPKGSTKNKQEIIAYYSQENFRLRTSEAYGQLLQELRLPANYDQLSPALQITMDREWKDYQHFCRVPADFNRELVLLRSQCEKAWEQARAENNWDLFEPWLEKNIAMTRQQALYMEPDQDPYDTLLDSHQRGVTCDMTEELFREIKEGLVPLLEKIEARPAPDTSKVEALKASFDEIQALQNYLLRYVGFDLNRGTTGESVHALTSTIDRNDIRITNNYTSRNPIDILLSAIHEAGHGLYNQNVDPAYYDTALESLTSADIHESQSRFLENTLARNIHFWEPIKDDLNALCPALKDVSPKEISDYVNKVQLTEVRIEADELTYCLHIILRFELEKMMFRDQVSASQLRTLWNEKFRDMFGFYPSDDTHGILQDLHWSSVYFGYFPSYLLGSVYDGIYLEAMEKELGSMDDLLAAGQIDRIVSWLRENIQRHGSLYNAPELVHNICGLPISAAPMLRYFEAKHQ